MPCILSVVPDAGPVTSHCGKDAVPPVPTRQIAGTPLAQARPFSMRFQYMNGSPYRLSSHMS